MPVGADGWSYDNPDPVYNTEPPVFDIIATPVAVPEPSPPLLLLDWPGSRRSGGAAGNRKCYFRCRCQQIHARASAKASNAAIRRASLIQATRLGGRKSANSSGKRFARIAARACLVPFWPSKKHCPAAPVRPTVSLTRFLGPVVRSAE